MLPTTHRLQYIPATMSDVNDPSLDTDESDLGEDLPGDCDYADALSAIDSVFTRGAEIGERWIDDNLAVLSKHLHTNSGPFLEIAARHGSLLLARQCCENRIDHADLNNALGCAIRRNRSDIAAMLCGKGADCMGPAPGGNMLTLAAECGHQSLLALLLEHGGDIQRSIDSGNNPLLAAVRHARTSVVDFLATIGFGPNEPDRNGHLPLASAVRDGDIVAVAGLLRAGADPFKRDGDAISPCKIALDQDKAAIARLLHGIGDESIGCNEIRETISIFFSRTVANTAESVKDLAVLLRKIPALTKVRNECWATALQVAFASRKSLAVKALLDLGADVDAECFRGGTLMHGACSQNDLDLVQRLIEAGANVDVADHDGNTPMHWSALKGHAGVFRLLSNKGARTDTRNRDRLTPLHYWLDRGEEVFHGLVKEWPVDRFLDLKLDQFFDRDYKTRNRHMANLIGSVLIEASMRSNFEPQWAERIKASPAFLAAILLGAVAETESIESYSTLLKLFGDLDPPIKMRALQKVAVLDGDGLDGSGSGAYQIISTLANVDDITVTTMSGNVERVEKRAGRRARFEWHRSMALLFALLQACDYRCDVDPQEYLGTHA